MMILYTVENGAWDFNYEEYIFISHPMNGANGILPKGLVKVLAFCDQKDKMD